MPMARLAEYMADFAALLGNRTEVHFVRLEGGSTNLVTKIDYQAVPRVKQRLLEVRQRNAPAEAMKAFERIDSRLAQDNATGRIEAAGIDNVIEFPGILRFKAIVGPVYQTKEIDGVPIAVGGRNDPVSVHLQEGDRILICNARRELAKRIAAHIFTDVIRAQGHGRWHQDEDQIWVMDWFVIDDFRVLEPAPLSQVVSRLRSITGSDLENLRDPYWELSSLRQDTA
jgi:hypothetical protein